MLNDITPVILTYNEAPNIERTLRPLSWAREVVIVDSNSTDDTLAIAARFANVRTVQRPFDTHARQWRFAIEETGITSDWVLRLDADYSLLFSQLTGVQASGNLAFGRQRFDFTWTPRWQATTGEVLTNQGTFGTTLSPFPGGRLNLSSYVTYDFDKSLLREEIGDGTHPRFMMLETVREYALEQLDESGEAETIRHRHAGYFLMLAETGDPLLRGHEQAAWVARLELERDNLRAALGYSDARIDELERSGAIACHADGAANEMAKVVEASV